MVAGAEVVGVANASEGGDDVVLIRVRASGRWIHEVVADGRARFRNVESGQCMRYGVAGPVSSMGDCDSERAEWLVGTHAQIHARSGAARSIQDTRVLNSILDAHSVELKESGGDSWNIEKV